MKRILSPSPSSTTPKRAPRATTASAACRLLSSFRGLGSWWGKVPSGSAFRSTASTPRRSATRRKTRPAEPLDASMTMRPSNPERAAREATKSAYASRPSISGNDALWAARGAGPGCEASPATMASTSFSPLS